jgi:hypothetical protein
VSIGNNVSSIWSKAENDINSAALAAQ